MEHLPQQIAAEDELLADTSRRAYQHPERKFETGVRAERDHYIARMREVQELQWPQCEADDHNQRRASEEERLARWNSAVT